MGWDRVNVDWILLGVGWKLFGVYVLLHGLERGYMRISRGGGGKVCC